MARQAALLAVTFVAVLALLAGAAFIARLPAASPVPGASAAGSGPAAAGGGTGPPTASASGGPTSGASPPGSAVPASPSAPPPGDPVLVGAGDIAACGLDGARQTASLVEAIPGATVFTAGDNAYDSGSAAEFRDCYAPTWGRFVDRTRPALGNHDAETPGAAGYFDYFGAAAGPRPDGWYSYELGTWHVIVLNSNCPGRAGCSADSDQGRWLAADLAADRARCTLAIWHAPRFSSGVHGSDAAYGDFWSLLYGAGADVVVNGHDHDYERFLPQDPAGRRDEARGLAEFVVGTGGADQRDFGPQLAANSLVRTARLWGVLELTLHPTGYDFQFTSVDGTFSDRGTGSCH